MSEIEKFFEDLKAVPDSQRCVMNLSFNNPQPTLGYVLARPDTPACKVKEHLLDVLDYCSIAFNLPYDASFFKKHLFAYTDH